MSLVGRRSVNACHASSLTSPVTGWDAPDVRHAYLRFVRDKFEDLLSPFTWNEVALSPDVQMQALLDMAVYNLDAQDAVHLASMRLAGVTALASYDERFRRVERLHLWNDLLHTWAV